MVCFCVGVCACMKNIFESDIEKVITVVCVCVCMCKCVCLLSLYVFMFVCVCVCVVADARSLGGIWLSSRVIKRAVVCVRTATSLRLV